ncbi:plasmid mobilization protein [Labilibaculum manganireducens]|uniref:plasmid mobilization protein n=1 Tax=Labilibaculum manganireducens TaxID=1940525 RepID=UPI0029F56119|nr:plasmid mobilization relaxosome protein MobC [Labilibaculum manganireducens]
MARPRVAESKKLLFQTNIRLSKSEREFAEEEAAKIPCSVANWIRRSAFSKGRISVRYSGLDRNTYRNLSAIGSNLNQLTKRINNSHYPKIFNELLELKKLLVEIHKQILK